MLETKQIKLHFQSKILTLGEVNLCKLEKNSDLLKTLYGGLIDTERVLTVPPNCLNNPRWRVLIIIR